MQQEVYDATDLIQIFIMVTLFKQWIPSSFQSYFREVKLLVKFERETSNENVFKSRFISSGYVWFSAVG